jgi:alpha-tubulin suppressor-like RCC1 family protein
VLTLGTSDWEHVAAGSASSCALTPAGAAYCWGWNVYGKLGTGVDDGLKYHEPQAVVGGHTFVSLTMATAQTCGLKADHSAWCWGGNQSGTLGRGGAPTYSEPVPRR